MTYRLLRNGLLIEGTAPGMYAGHKGYRIFGLLSCANGKRMKRENRVFFANLDDCVNEGYRPCKLCKPMDEQEFAAIKHFVPFQTLREFYDSGRQFR